MDDNPKNVAHEKSDHIKYNPYESPPNDNMQSGKPYSLPKSISPPHPIAVLAILSGCFILGPLEAGIFLQYFLPNGTIFHGRYPDAFLVGFLAAVPFIVFTIVMYFVGVHVGRNLATDKIKRNKNNCAGSLELDNRDD